MENYELEILKAWIYVCYENLIDSKKVSSSQLKQWLSYKTYQDQRIRAVLYQIEEGNIEKAHNFLHYLGQEIENSKRSREGRKQSIEYLAKKYHEIQDNEDIMITSAFQEVRSPFDDVLKLLSEDPFITINQGANLPKKSVLNTEVKNLPVLASAIKPPEQIVHNVVVVDDKSNKKAVKSLAMNSMAGVIAGAGTAILYHPIAGALSFFGIVAGGMAYSTISQSVKKSQENKTVHSDYSENTTEILRTIELEMMNAECDPTTMLNMPLILDITFKPTSEFYKSYGIASALREDKTKEAYLAAHQCRIDWETAVNEAKKAKIPNMSERDISVAHKLLEGILHERTTYSERESKINKLKEMLSNVLSNKAYDKISAVLDDKQASIEGAKEIEGVK